MTDDDIRNIMYNHANAFTSGIIFSDQGILDFAHELLGTVPLEPEPEPEDDDPRASYKHLMDIAEDSIARFMGR
ncbi:MAG: hypothetical protein EBY83_00195 [Verrucomicrobia bacterium]|nr:hypothetical protein [Verrucomicrobiota bacterium]